MDLKTTYLGLKLKNPLVPSASPLSRNVDSMKRLEDAGASAVVMYSLFEEQIAHDAAELEHYLEYGSHSQPEAMDYFPRPEEYNLGPDQYVELLHSAKQALGIPVIGSLNGISTGGWIDYAKKLEQAGADALELNIYYIPTDPVLSSQEVEERYVNVLLAVKRAVRIPVAVKLSPYFSSFANVAARLDKAGANGLVLFNRFYQPDFDLEALEVSPNVLLSTSDAIRLPLRWIAILHGMVKTSLAGTSGVHTAEDVIKLIMAGADVAMMCSALLKHGPKHLTMVLEGLNKWMVEHEYLSVEQMKGSMSQASVADPAAFERANYMKALNRFKQS
ncbi:MAG TPA: dihydroorotate dehydrogenase-like protein [Bacteroidetes bacterium]|nr:MAG: dihydroorotate dehydrogenase [Ignavibacteria bacterium GWA2_54_16]HCA82118.1 dihydroorotate dehydrogenase-like protein [Bacteroidota bacterium]